MNQLFEMIPCSSGELPEKVGEFLTSDGRRQFNPTGEAIGKQHFHWIAPDGSYCESPEWWLKPVEQPIPEGEGCTCQKCGSRYRVDLMVPDALWNQIKPEGKENGAGLLCGHCLISAMEARGYGHLNCQDEASARMTLQEAKDEVAKQYGYISFAHGLADRSQLESKLTMSELINEAMELYLSSNTPVTEPVAMRPNPEHLWDEHSETIDDDISSLNMVAGRSVMFREDFMKAIELYRTGNAPNAEYKP